MAVASIWLWVLCLSVPFWAGDAGGPRGTWAFVPAAFRVGWSGAAGGLPVARADRAFVHLSPLFWL